MRSADHSRSKRTWSSTLPPASAQSSIQNAFARRNAARSRAATGASGSREEAVPRRERGGGRVRRARPCPAARAAIPATSSVRLRRASRRTRTRPSSSAAARERGRVQHDAAGSLKLHRLFEDRRSLKVTEPCPTLRQATAAPDPDPGRAPPGRLRTVSRQGDRRRFGRRLRDDLQGRPRHPPRSRALSRGRIAQVARVAAGAARQRPLGRQLPAGGARALAVHDRSLGRPLRDAARRARPQARGRTGRARRRALRGGGAIRPRRAGRRGAPLRRSWARRTGTARRRSTSRSRSTSSGCARGSAPGTSSSPAAGAVSRASRRCCPHLAELGFDVVYLPADPPDRRDEPQGPQQRAEGGEGRPRQPLGDRRARRAATTRSTPSWGR